jgi:hypothetical protein
MSPLDHLFTWNPIDTVPLGVAVGIRIGNHVRFGIPTIEDLAKSPPSATWTLMVGEKVETQ